MARNPQRNSPQSLLRATDRPYFRRFLQHLKCFDWHRFRQDSKDTSGIGDLILDSFPVFAFFKSAVENIGDPSGQPGNRREIEAQVKKWFSELHHKENKPVLIIIDGGEWLDEGSADIVNSLLHWHMPDNFLTVALSANDQLPELINESLLQKHSITEEFNDNNRSGLLKELELGLDITDFLKAHFTGKTEGLWKHLTESIKHLAEDSKFEWSENTGTFLFSPVDQLNSIPGFHQRIGDKIKENPEHKELLRCAAILGTNFKATILAEVIQSQGCNYSKTGICRGNGLDS